MEVRFKGEVVCDQCGKAVPATLRIGIYPNGLRLLPPEDTEAVCYNARLGAVAYCSAVCEQVALQDAVGRR